MYTGFVAGASGEIKRRNSELRVKMQVSLIANPTEARRRSIERAGVAMLAPNQRERDFRRQFGRAPGKGLLPQPGAVDVVDGQNLIVFLEVGVLKHRVVFDLPHAQEWPVPDAESQFLVGHVRARFDDRDVHDGVLP